MAIGFENEREQTFNTSFQSVIVGDGSGTVVERKKKGKVTLFANAWVEAKSEIYDFEQVVTIEDATVTKTSMVDLQIDGNQLATFNNKVVALVAENEDCVVTVKMVGIKPLHDYTVQATVVEVEV